MATSTPPMRTGGVIAYLLVPFGRSTFQMFASVCCAP
jgi:hypothetical protein